MPTFYTSYPSEFSNHIWVLVPHILDPIFGEGSNLDVYTRYVPGHIHMIIGPELVSNMEWRIHDIISDSMHLPIFLAIPCSNVQNTTFDNFVQLISFRFHGIL